ncbi:MAG: HDIG domain-containing metalloprotein [bacterium]
MMLTRFWKKIGRPLLLRVLIWTEKHDKKPPSLRSSSESIFNKEIHIPTYVVAIVSGMALFIVLLLEIGLEPLKITGLVFFIVLIVTFIRYYLVYNQPELARDDDAITLLGVITILIILGARGIKIISLIPMFDWLSVYWTPIAASSMLIAILLNSRLAIVITVIIALITGMIYDFSFQVFFVMMISGISGVLSIIGARQRGDITRAMLHVAGGTALALIIIGLFNEWPWLMIRNETAAGIANGLISGGITLLFLPYLETFFSRTTNIRLVELADFNQPLLKRLMIEAPGTYHHSLVIASLAEQAAEIIGANALLCRVGAYYHDIGKLAKPEYFIENQAAMSNLHDELAPSMSSLVLISHVKEGIAFAKNHKIDDTIIQFISMHHGTSRIHFFYHKALEQSSEKNIEEEDFRYPGPKPRTKETAIIMLADSIEAASRTLEEPTHPRIKDLVKKISNNKFIDGQFDECPITLADLKSISESFVNTLSSYYHTRVEYPKYAEEQNGKTA